MDFDIQVFDDAVKKYGFETAFISYMGKDAKSFLENVTLSLDLWERASNITLRNNLADDQSIFVDKMKILDESFSSWYSLLQRHLSRLSKPTTSEVANKFEVSDPKNFADLALSKMSETAKSGVQLMQVIAYSEHNNPIRNDAFTRLKKLRLSYKEWANIYFLKLICFEGMQPYKLFVLSKMGNKAKTLSNCIEVYWNAGRNDRLKQKMLRKINKIPVEVEDWVNSLRNVLYPPRSEYARIWFNHDDPIVEVATKRLVGEAKTFEEHLRILKSNVLADYEKLSSRVALKVVNKMENLEELWSISFRIYRFTDQKDNFEEKCKSLNPSLTDWEKALDGSMYEKSLGRNEFALNQMLDKSKTFEQYYTAYYYAMRVLEKKSQEEASNFYTQKLLETANTASDWKTLLDIAKNQDDQKLHSLALENMSNLVFETS